MDKLTHYLEQLPEDRKNVLLRLRKVINDHLPDGFTETISYGMISFVVPHSIYPEGYHCDPKQPLPFISLAVQKNHIALYHMGIYVHAELLKWFTEEYPKHCKAKLDMGKSCIRFKNPATIPFGLIGELCAKINPTDWIRIYESKIKQ